MPTQYNRSYFSLFEIPYFNELTANQLGFSTEFNADTPNQYFVDSLNQLQNFFQGGRPTGSVTNPTNAGAWKPGMAVPEGYSVVTIQGKKVLRPNTTIFDATQGGQIPPPNPSVIPMPPNIWKTNPPPDVPVGTPGTTTKENVEKLETPLSNMLSGDLLKNLISSDTAIGAGLVVVAIVLVIIGLLSLR